MVKNYAIRKKQPSPSFDSVQKILNYSKTKQSVQLKGETVVINLN